MICSAKSAKIGLLVCTKNISFFSDMHTVEQDELMVFECWEILFIVLLQLYQPAHAEAGRLLLAGRRCKPQKVGGIRF